MQHPRWRKGDCRRGSSRKSSRGFQSRVGGGGWSARCSSPSLPPSITKSSCPPPRHLASDEGSPVGFAKRRVSSKMVFRVARGPDLGHRGCAGRGRTSACRRVTSCYHFGCRWRGSQAICSGGRQGGGQLRALFRCAPILNGVTLSYRGIRVPVQVYTRREAELAAPPCRSRRPLIFRSSCSAPCRASWRPSMWSEGQEVKAGDSSRRCRGREFGEPSALRARWYSPEDQCQG